jgi:multimeric flavodoxin WrbA
MRCSEEGAVASRPCRANDDDFGLDLCLKLTSCNGLIVASPVYFGNVTGLLKNFMDRTEPLLRYSKTGLKSGLKDKVGGAIAVGMNRNGGQETALQAILHWMLIHDMIVVGTSTDGHPGCYLGAAATMYPDYGRQAGAIDSDTLGLMGAKAIGRRVAEIAARLTSSPESPEGL